MPPLVVDVPPTTIDVPPTTIDVPPLAAPADPPPAGVTFLFIREGDEVADGGAVETAGDGLTEAAADVALSLDVADWLPQSVLVVLGSGVLLPAGLEVASSVASSVALVVALAVVALLAVVAGLLVADGLTVLGLSVGPPLPVDGGELVGGVDGLIGGCDGVIVGLAELGVGAGGEDADDGEHDASGVGPFCSAGLVPTAPVAVP